MSKAKKESSTSTLEIIDCGLVDYGRILTKQHELRDKRRIGEISDTVLIVEHSPVITLGARQSANRLRVEKEQLREKGIEVVEIRRGGGTTAHNPGQLVFYPILNLKELGLGINEYIRTLEEIGIELLGGLNVVASRRKGYPGLWIGEKKIASIGVRVSRGITCHGMAININNDLSIFDYIIPCGLDDVAMTSVFEQTGSKAQMDSTKKSLSLLLYRHFS
ncbi:MAG: lipoyl(octanoyl) transferase LipB [Phycisphaerales bacterium]|jgi:lipoate-protein ligase B